MSIDPAAIEAAKRFVKLRNDQSQPMGQMVGEPAAVLVASALLRVDAELALWKKKYHMRVDAIREARDRANALAAELAFLHRSVAAAVAEVRAKMVEDMPPLVVGDNQAAQTYAAVVAILTHYGLVAEAEP